MEPHGKVRNGRWIPATAFVENHIVDRPADPTRPPFNCVEVKVLRRVEPELEAARLRIPG